MKSHTPRVVAIVGAECSGKSSLAIALSQALDAIVVPEFLRQWCEEKGRTPTAHEQRIILAGQFRAQRSAFTQARARNCRWLVTDGAALLTAAYSLEYFDDDSLVATGLRHARASHHVLLTAPDIPWVPDGHLRDGPVIRTTVHDRLTSLLRDAGIAYHLISGNPGERLRASLALLR
jgi:nicotinamide riboside kinase